MNSINDTTGTPTETTTAPAILPEAPATKPAAKAKTAKAPMGSARWISCASCHPDGREDSLTWATPDGPRQTIMLAGHENNSAPYGWAGKFDNLPDYTAETFRRLGGSGVTGHELDALQLPLVLGTVAALAVFAWHRRVRRIE